MIRTYRGNTPRIHPKAYVHDSAEVIGRVTIAQDASIWPLAVLRGDVDSVRVGVGSNIQDLSVVHCREGSPAVIGAGVTVGHRVIIHGAKVGDGCLVGMGAIVMEATVGPRSLIAAGALILKGMKIPPESLVMGSPAKVVRRLTAKELAQLARSGRDYVGHGREHARSSKVVFPS